MELTTITDINPYFEKKDDKWIFTGKKLEIYIPKIYQERGLLVLGEIATTLGIFQLRINDTFCATMLILARIQIEFLNESTVIEQGIAYTVLTLEKDSVFIVNSNIVKDGNVIYEVFITFLALGKIPPFITYDKIQRLFDNDGEHCGVPLGINHSIFEMIYSAIYRDSEDPYQHYRHTPMTKPPVIVPLHQISHGPSSTTARIVGSYLNDGITASLIDDTERTPSKIENLLRA